MAAAWSGLLAGYGDEQLALFLELFDRMHEMSKRQLAGLHLAHWVVDRRPARAAPAAG